VDEYKHQWNVAEAAARLRREGMPVDLELAGKSYPAALRRLHATLERVDPDGAFVHYRGPVPFRDVHNLYDRAEVFVFASSCENMPNVLLEAMASGLPIACARRGPMPAMLGDAGVYFDPDDPASIADAVRSLAADATLRERCAKAAFARSSEYSWGRCAARTLAFLGVVARSRREGAPAPGPRPRAETPLEERRCES
jgi:glycosyltransferase involved in cell wall biosynthesis